MWFDPASGHPYEEVVRFYAEAMSGARLHGAWFLPPSLSQLLWLLTHLSSFLSGTCTSLPCLASHLPAIQFLLHGGASGSWFK
jgi:hypothetical protein